MISSDELSPPVSLSRRPLRDHQDISSPFLTEVPPSGRTLSEGLGGLR